MARVRYAHLRRGNAIEPPATARVKLPAAATWTALALACACCATPVDAAAAGLDRIEHIVVVYAENRSFDHLYGLFPGANGIANATPEQATQVDHDGTPLPEPMWQWALDHTLADGFFMAAHGGSFINHQWLICACTPRDEAAPESVRAQLDGQGRLKRRPGSPASAKDGRPLLFDGAFSPDGYAVNSAQPPYQPSGLLAARDGDPRCAAGQGRFGRALAPQMQKTIGDTLSARGVSGAWYAGGMQWPEARRTIIYGNAVGTVSFQPHHQPFNYYVRFAPGTADRARRLKDYTDLVAGIERGELPAVAFYKPQGSVNQHPGYTDLLSGDAHIAALVAKIKASPLWASSAIIVTYDENGGFWDHAAPPSGDRWGPGTRIPAIIVSPFAKKGHVDHSVYDTTSILKLITLRFGLEPLPGLRPNVGDLTAAFDLGR